MNAQRKAATPRVLEVRSLTEADLEYLRQPASRNVVQKLNDAHLRMARLFAQGLTNYEVAGITGYNPARVSLLRNDPAMRERVARLQEAAEAETVDDMVEFDAVAIHNMTAAEHMIADKIEAARDAGETLPMRELIAISSDRMDRFGYGKKNMNVNLNIDMAAKLEAAIARTKKVSLE